MTSRNWRRLNIAMPWLVIIGLLILWQAVVEIFSIAGLYSMVSTVLNGFDVPPRIGGETPF